MKNNILTVIAVISSFMAQAQSAAFNNAALANKHGREVISFSIPREQNVRHYRIEASNDSVHFGVIATIPSKGDAVFNTNYNFDVTAYQYTYYRIGKVEMNGQMPYSAIVSNRQQVQPEGQPNKHTPQVVATGDIVKQ